MAQNVDNVMVQVARGMLLVDCIPLHRQGLDNETYGCCKIPVVKTKILDVQIQMLGFSDSENGCTQGSFLKRMHTRVFLAIDTRKVGTNPGCTQPL